MINQGRKRRLVAFFSLFKAALKFLFNLAEGFKENAHHFILGIDNYCCLLGGTPSSYKENRL